MCVCVCVCDLDAGRASAAERLSGSPDRSTGYQGTQRLVPAHALSIDPHVSTWLELGKSPVVYVVDSSSYPTTCNLELSYAGFAAQEAVG
jgi:hypothetical protein